MVPNDPIRRQFCTGHYSQAVVVCVNLWPDLIVIFYAKLPWPVQICDLIWSYFLCRMANTYHNMIWIMSSQTLCEMGRKLDGSKYTESSVPEMIYMVIWNQGSHKGPSYIVDMLVNIKGTKQLWTYTPGKWDFYCDIQYMVMFMQRDTSAKHIWVRSWRCACHVTWFCYQMIAKPGNKTGPPSRPDPYQQAHEMCNSLTDISTTLPTRNCIRTLSNGVCLYSISLE